MKATARISTFVITLIMTIAIIMGTTVFSTSVYACDNWYSYDEYEYYEVHNYYLYCEDGCYFDDDDWDMNDELEGVSFVHGHMWPNDLFTVEGFCIDHDDTFEFLIADPLVCGTDVYLESGVYDCYGYGVDTIGLALYDEFGDLVDVYFGTNYCEDDEFIIDCDLSEECGVFLESGSVYYYFFFIQDGDALFTSDMDYFMTV